MAAADVSAVTARIRNRIQSVTDVGLVWEHDLFARADLRSMLVSQIGGQPSLRAWWITGPTMTGRRMVTSPSGLLERTWVYRVCGVEGLDESGSSLLTLRNLAVLVSDAIDADPTLANTCHRSQPCNWSVPPENRAAFAGVGVSYVEISKTVVTLSATS
jgi:hypothetical protein